MGFGILDLDLELIVFRKGLEAAESPGLPLPEPERKPAGDGEQITSAEAPMVQHTDGQHQRNRGGPSQGSGRAAR